MRRHYIREWFLESYTHASLEVRKKMQFLVIFGMVVFCIYIPLALFGFFRSGHTLIAFGGDLIVPVAIILALIFIRKGKPEAAVNSLMLTLLTTFVGSVFGVIFSDWPVEEIREFIPFIIHSQISETTLILLFELLIISLFAIKKYQLKVFISASFIIVFITYIVLAIKLNDGNIFDAGVFPFFQLIFLLFSSIVAYLISTLSKALLSVAERSLEDSEERYRTLIENLQEGVFIIVDGNIEFVNDSLAQMYGYSREEMEGMEFHQLISEESYKEIKTRYEQRMQGMNEHWEYEIRATPKGGEEKLFMVSTKMLNYLGKKAIMGTMKDVTEKRRAEEALMQSEKRYKGLFEGSPIAHVAEDMSGVKEFFDTLCASGITDFRAYFSDNPKALDECFSKIIMLETNSANLELFGAESLEELTENYDTIFREEAKEVFKEEFIALAEGKQTFTAEQLHYTLQGEKVYTLLHTNVLPGYEETLERVIVTLVDITARNKAEEELIRRDNILSGATKAIEKLITRTDFDKAVNGALQNIGEQVDVDRMYVYENSLASDGELQFSMKYEWTNGKVSAEIDNPAHQAVSYAEGFSRWRELLAG